MGLRDGRALGTAKRIRTSGEKPRRLESRRCRLESPLHAGVVLWQSERHEGVAGRTLPAPASHCNRHVLLSVDAVRTRRRIGAGFELSLPEHLAGSGIECAELM